MIRRDLLTIYERDGEPVSEPRTKFFHQVQSETGAVGTIDVKKTDKGIESRARECGDAIVTKQRIKKGKQTIDSIQRRSPAADCKSEVGTLLFEHESEDGKIDLRRNSLGAAHY